MNLISQTPRLVLRELRIEEAEKFYELNSNLNVIKYTGNLPFKSILDAEKFLKNYSDYQQNGMVERR